MKETLLGMRKYLILIFFCCGICISFGFYFYQREIALPTGILLPLPWDSPQRKVSNRTRVPEWNVFDEAQGSIDDASDQPQNEFRASNFESRVVCDGGSCCDGIYVNRSCAWTNLYFDKKTFYAFVVNTSNISYELHAVSSGIRPFPMQIKAHPIFFPVVKSFESNEELENFSSNFKPMTQEERGLHLILSGGGHGNTGHAILDEVYSLWLCVCKFKLENSPRFVAISLDTGLTDGANPANVEISRLFFGNFTFVQHWDPTAAYRFDLVLAGVGHMGLTTPGADYVMPGRSYDALKKFRNRFYQVYRHPPPIVRASSRREDPLVVLIVPNKRPSNGVLSPTMATMLNAAGYDAVYLDFERLSYGERLPLYRRTDIFLTGVGTGANNAFFLSDGAVVVNLGTNERSASLSFQEECIFAAMYWTRVVYPTYDQFRRMSPQTAMELINASRKLILDDFDCGPSSSGHDNFSPIGKVAAEYLSRDAKAWGAIVGSYYPGNDVNLECLILPERLVCEVGPWGTNECTVIDKKLLLELRAKYEVCCSCR